MGRPREFDTDLALDRCMAIFRAKGFEATSIDDLTAATTLSRPSFYNAFGSKKDLYLTCLDRFARQVIGPHVAPLEDRGIDPFDAVEAFLRSMLTARNAEARVAGCLLVNAVVEVTAQGDADLFRAANDPMVSVEHLIADRLAAVVEDSRAVARFVICNIQGIRVMARRGASAHVISQLIGTLMVAIRPHDRLNTERALR